MPEYHGSPVLESELKKAISSYGLVADSIERIPEGCYALVYKIRCGEKKYIVRIRSEMATAQHVVFARKWGQAVSAEVVVPVPLKPLDCVPQIANRCVEIGPYMEHDQDGHGYVGPQAWITIGQWLGCMHRLGMPLLGDAPVALPYGNYPHDALIDSHREHAHSFAPTQSLSLLPQAEKLLTQCRHFLKPHRKYLTSGVVHGDMHFWNVLYSSGGKPVAIIDLDFLQHGYLIADIAYASIWLDAWEHRLGGEWLGVMERYIKAYESGRQSPLNAAERECLPWFRALTLVFFFFQNSLSNIED
ncbi:phosphotransferase enzyme family protein, partial [Candidatus Poribacteria bacterium]